MNRLISHVAAAGAAMMLGATALAHSEDKDEKAAPDPRIGETVNRICFQRNINGWRNVKGVDNAVLLERGVNDWYYLDLAGACRESLFRSAIAIGIDSHPAGGCVTRGDVILVRDTPGFTQRCIITEIRKWDEKAKAEDEGDGNTAPDADDDADPEAGDEAQ